MKKHLIRCKRENVNQQTVAEFSRFQMQRSALTFCKPNRNLVEYVEEYRWSSVQLREDEHVG